MYQPPEEYLDELYSQIDEHSPNDVRFYIVGEDDPVPVYVTDVIYRDGEIKVELAK